MKEVAQRIITGIALGLFVGGVFFFLPAFYFSLLICIALAIILITEWPLLFSVRSIPFWCIMPLYPILPCVLLIILNENSIYRLFIPYMIALVVAADTGAYFTGKWYGNHLIAPRISPKKSWEGFAGGYALSTLLLFLLFWANASWFYLLISFMLNITALAGDLFESYLKRRVGLKDSGNLLPGHGGLLDRFDSILAVTILVYTSKEFLVSYFLKCATISICATFS